MLEQQQVSEMVLYSCTRLRVLKGKDQIGTGTGSYYTFRRENSQNVPLLVTNKHVVEGGDTIEVVGHYTAVGDAATHPSGEVFAYKLNYDRVAPINHPSEDLCAFPIAHIHNEVAATGRAMFAPGLHVETIPKEEDWQWFSAREPVVMVGCPRGMFDEVNNLPIMRNGYTASALFKRYQGKPHFLVDMACFPGSSGSPVFNINEGSFFDRKTNSLVLGSRFWFVGVLFAGPTISNRGEIVMTAKPHVETATMMHLGEVIRSTALLELVGGVEADLRKAEAVETWQAHDANAWKQGLW